VRRELLGQLVAEDFRESNDVVEELGVEELAARKAALEHRGAQHGAAGIERGCHPGRTRTDDYDVVVANCGR